MANDALEFLNRATHNSPIKLELVEIADKKIPSVTFSEVEDIENPDVFESCWRSIIQTQIEWGRTMKATDDPIGYLTETLNQMVALTMHTAKPALLKKRHAINRFIDSKIGGW